MNDDTELEKDEVETDLEDEDTGSYSGGGSGGGGSIEAVADIPDDASITAREAVRKQLQDDIEAFLARGGKINEIPPNVVADPPRKPQNNYGGQPI